MNSNDYNTGYRDGFIWGTVVTFITLVIAFMDKEKSRKKD